MTGKIKGKQQLSESLIEKNLLLFKKFLISPFLEKKIAAMQKFKFYCEAREFSQMMCRWIIDECIVEYIFADSNPEMISRIQSLIELLIWEDAFTKEQLLLIWKNCIDEHKHEAVVKEILDLLIELGKRMKIEHLDIIFKEISSLK